MSTNQNDIELSDTELDQLLQYTSKPLPSSDFESRLLEKLSTEIIPNNIVHFPRLRKIPLWLTAVPLAASLVLGIWLGTSEAAVDYLPFSTQSMAQNANTDALYNLTEDNLS